MSRLLCLLCMICSASLGQVSLKALSVPKNTASSPNSTHFMFALILFLFQVSINYFGTSVACFLTPIAEAMLINI